MRDARALLGWSVRDLAKAARLHYNTVNNFEVGRYAGTEATLAVVRKVLEKAGVEFTNGKKLGVFRVGSASRGGADRSRRPFGELRDQAR